MNAQHLVISFRKSARIVVKTLIFSAALQVTSAFALSSINTEPAPQRIVQTNVVNDYSRQPQLHSESRSESRAVGFDNDVFVPGSRDQDYTYGINLEFSGKSAARHWLASHQLLEAVDEALSISTSGLKTRKMEYGLFGFTPEDIQSSAVTRGDRPYASLIYSASTVSRYNPINESLWTSSLTFGALGLAVVGKLQEHVHALSDSESPNGWANQISDGGELTARYSISRQRLIARTEGGIEAKRAFHVSLGYITEASASISARIGHIRSTWLAFNPELTNYGEKSTPNADSHVFEHFFYAGLAIKARAYNAFLQGQFRDSKITYTSEQLNHILLEAWAGYSLAFRSGYRLTYTLRGHTSELKDGPGKRNVLWGGIQVAKSFR